MEKQLAMNVHDAMARDGQVVCVSDRFHHDGQRFTTLIRGIRGGPRKSLLKFSLVLRSKHLIDGFEDFDDEIDHLGL